MPGQRRDYLLTQIELLGKFVARLARTREEAGLHEAINLAQQLQGKLFGRPPAEFLRLEVSAQLDALRAGETKPAGEEKCLTYATLLRETATLYGWQGRDDFAFGARQLALHVAVCVALEQPEGPSRASALVKELADSLHGHPLHPPLPALLDEYRRRRQT